MSITLDGLEDGDVDGSVEDYLIIRGVMFESLNLKGTNRNPGQDRNRRPYKFSNQVIYFTQEWFRQHNDKKELGVKIKIKITDLRSDGDSCVKVSEDLNEDLGLFTDKEIGHDPEGL